MKAKFSFGVIICVAYLTIIALLAACGQGSRHVPTLTSVGTQQAGEPATMEQPAVTWPGALPEDKVQPWEELDATGNVVPPKSAEGPERSRRASNLNFDSIFAAGIERYLEAGDVTDFGEASSFASGAAGEELVSYAIYRLPLGVEQPGTITADVNLHNGSAYYIGVGDYSVNSWHWYGPFDVTHVRFNVPDAEYTSGLGNLMLAVVAYDGASFDVVALGANARDAADTEAPLIPAEPTLTPVSGGVLAEWLPVVAGDLAGYRIYADGVEVLEYIEGGTSIVVPCAEEVEVTLTAVDTSGNESELSDPATETPLVGEMPAVELTATAASGVRNDVIELAATGAETYDWDIDGDGTWDFTDDPTGMADADTSNLGLIRPALRAHTSDGGFSLSAISLFITGNFRPVVMATGDVTYGQVPLDVEFTVIGEDDDGTIDEYAWDLDGDGTFDDSSPTNPSPLAHSYPDAGMFNAKFRATDNDGAWAVDTVAVQVLAGPANLPPVALLTAEETVFHLGETRSAGVSFDASGSYDPDGGSLGYAFSTGTVGNFNSLAVVNGNPAISYWDVTNTALKYVRASDASGGSWDTPVTVDSAGIVGAFTSLAMVNGNPAVSYYDATNGDLKYVRASDANGGSWGAPVAADSAGNVGGYTSLAVVNGNPAISYCDVTNDHLKYVRATDASGSSWDSPVTVDSTGAVGQYTSLAIVNGNPAISYRDVTNLDLKYVRASDADGSSWESPVTVDSDGDVGKNTSLAVINGNPAISYFDDTNDDLKYVRASDANGSTWEPPVVVDGAGWVGEYTCLAIVNGNPAISYYDETKDNLNYVRASDANGSIWGSPVAVYSPGDVGGYTSLAIVNGKPAISYYDFTNQDLKFAYPRLD
jgi:hypothetical protein